MGYPVLSAERLAPAVRRALQTPDAWPLQWSCELLDLPAINPGTAGLYRVYGTARVGEGLTSPWRMVLKVVHLPDFTGTPLENGYIRNPEDWNYWKREVLARRSGLPDRFTSPLRPVRCYETEDVDDTTAWLWIEELGATPPRPAWSLTELARAAYDLGAFAAQGTAYVEDVQDIPWAARGWLRGWLTTFRALGSDHALSHDACWTHPLVRGRLPASAHESFSRLMAAAEPLLDRLDALPGTVAHLDTQASNLFAETGPEGHRTVAIDWGFFGTASIGEDLGHHYAQNVYFGVVHPGDAEEHERTATEAYLSGLRAYGWRGDEKDVRFAAVAAGALRMLPFAASYLADLCPEFGEVDTWPEEAAAKEARNVEAIMDTWCQTFVVLTVMAQRALRRVVDN